MMDDEACIKFMSKMAGNLEKAFSKTIEKELPRDNKIPLDVMFTGIAMFVAVASERLYSISGMPSEMKVPAVKEFCDRLERTIIQLIRKKSVH